MLFVSGGAKFLEKKIKIARRRMFLFAESESRPTSDITYPQLITLINKSRGFCAKLNADNSMDCVRAAGWKGGKFWYNYVPSAAMGTNAPQVVSPQQTTAFDVFCRYYAIGRTSISDTPMYGRQSLLENMANARPEVPNACDMIMPPFASGVSSLKSNPSSNVDFAKNSSGTITNGAGGGLGSWSRNNTQYFQTIEVTAFDATQNQAQVTAPATLSVYMAYATTGMDYGGPSTSFPRLFSGYRYEQTYGERYYSDGKGWQYTTTTYQGKSASGVVSDDASSYYATGGMPDTPSYNIGWGMMVIATTLGAPMYCVISNAQDDFSQAGAVTPGVKPSLKMLPFTDTVFESKFHM